MAEEKKMPAPEFKKPLDNRIVVISRGGLQKITSSDPRVKVVE